MRAYTPLTIKPSDAKTIAQNGAIDNKAILFAITHLYCYSTFGNN